MTLKCMMLVAQVLHSLHLLKSWEVEYSPWKWHGSVDGVPIYVRMVWFWQEGDDEER